MLAQRTERETTGTTARHRALWCLLVLGLLLSHHALMLTASHAEVMAPLHGTAGITSPPDEAGMGSEAAHERHQAPPGGQAILEDCPAIAAVLPALLLLLLLVTCARLSGSAPPLVAAAHQVAAPHHPPPRPAAQRRALLQVFRL